MAENWKELWNKNYRGEGDCAELQAFIKKLNYGARTNISYLPWATVDRIFQLQDGTHEFINAPDWAIVYDQKGEITKSPYNSIVHADIAHTRDRVNAANGIIETELVFSYFILCKVEWQGRKHTEKYPLQDSNGRPITVWTQNELNKLSMRALVKAIARVSGIGYKLFEDGDLQFDDPDAKNTTGIGDNKGQDASAAQTAAAEKLKKDAESKGKKGATTTPPPTAEPTSTQEPTKASEAPTPSPAVAPEPVEPTSEPSATPTPQKAAETVTVAEAIERIKKLFIQGKPEHTGPVKAMLKTFTVAKVSDLPEEKIYELYHQIN